MHVPIPLFPCLDSRPSTALVAKGVAFHHGKLEASDRVKVEELFRSGLLSAVASTSTLALGVSLSPIETF